MELLWLLVVIVGVVLLALVQNRKEDKRTIEDLQGQLAAEKQKAEGEDASGHIWIATDDGGLS